MHKLSCSVTLHPSQADVSAAVSFLLQSVSVLFTWLSRASNYIYGPISKTSNLFIDKPWTHEGNQTQPVNCLQEVNCAISKILYLCCSPLSLRSLINILNIPGPDADPWSILLLTSFHAENWTLIPFLCFLPLIWVLIHVRTLLPTLRVTNFFNSLLWKTLSKGFWKV